MTVVWRRDAPNNLIQLAIGRCMIATMDGGKWLELGMLTGTHERVQSHPRLLRSLRFGDGDYDACVLEIVPDVLATTPRNGGAMPNRDAVTEYLAEHDPRLFTQLMVSEDDATLPDGTVLSAAEAAAARLEVGEMRRQIERVACHEHGTALSGFLPGSWDHLDCQSWDHSARLAGGSWAGSFDRLVSVVDGKVERAWDFGRSA